MKVKAVKKAKAVSIVTRDHRAANSALLEPTRSPHSDDAMLLYWSVVYCGKGRNAWSRLLIPNCLRFAVDGSTE